MDDYERYEARVREVCAALPGVREEDAWVGVRWKVRANTFAHVLPIETGWPPSFARSAGTDGPAVVLTFRSAHPELDALLVGDQPFFGPLWGRTDLGLVLGPETDWAEVGELLVESYRLRAPARLASSLDTR